MGSEELSWIKERQREFQTRFNKPLHVDWNMQFGSPEFAGDYPRITCTPEEHFAKCCSLFGTTPEKVRHPEGNIKRMSPERFALLKFSIDAHRQKWPRRVVADIVNKTDTLIYHYIYNIYNQEKHLIGEA